MADSAVDVHPTALVAAGAKIGMGVKIGPYAVIGPKVQLGDRVKIGPHALIEGRTSVGADTCIYAFASIGTAPQDLKYNGQDTELRIGCRNQIREYVNISIGTESGGGLTQLGDDNLLMAYTHIAHDVVVANHCIFANGVQLAGHVHVANNAVFGGMSGGHQFCRFGQYVMVAAGAIVVQDVMPYCMVQGDRAEVSGLNLVGLRRAGVKGERLSAIKAMFQLVFRQNLTLEEAQAAIESEIEAGVERAAILDFLKASQRGICR